MAESPIYVGQPIVLNFIVHSSSRQVQDLSGATGLRIVLHRVNGARKNGTMSLVGTGADGAMTYTASTTDLNEPGLWKAQAFYTISGVEYPTEVVSFTVLPKG